MSIFDRYEPFTDVATLKEFSAKPLRKSVRVNTLKMSVEDFKKHAAEKGWKLTQVPWCAEGFFIDREDRTNALGKDWLHLIGCFYMQEAASMLPPSLLGPMPDDIVLDMSAAPGSKTTQVASALAGTGLIVANDVQEKRLWTLKNATHRLGVSNLIVTKKVGQWFSKHMTERFDRVLCDAPCTAQGTARKDGDALLYCSLENIEKMSRLQYQLLEAAIHSAKVGGTIVYSTCTLTPEENEGVVLQILERFKGHVEVVDPRTLKMDNGQWKIDQLIEDSVRVQASLKEKFQFSILNFPFLRLWPQTEDTEGFFCAVLRKTARTREVEPLEWVHFQEREVTRKDMQEIAKRIGDVYGSSFLHEGDLLYERGGESLILVNHEVASFGLPVEDYAIGMPFAKRLKDRRVFVAQETVTLRGHEATANVLDVNEEELGMLLAAKDIPCPADRSGHQIVRYEGRGVGLGLAKDGRLKNNLPRWMVGM